MTASSSSIPLVRAAFGRPFLLTLSRLGIPLTRYQRQYSISISDHEDPLALMPERPWWLLANDVANREGIGDLCLRIGNSVPFNKISSLAPQLSACITLAELLQAFCEAAKLQSTHARFDLLPDRSGVWIRSVGPPLLDNHADCAQLRLYHVLGCIQIAQTILGKDWRPTKVKLSQSHNQDVEDSPILAAEQLYFNQPYSAVHLSHKDLARRSIKPNEPGSRPLNIEQPPETFIDSIRAAIIHLFPSRNLRVETLAEIANMPVRTFQRRLRDQGVSFTRIVEQARFETACTLVAQPDLPLQAVSGQLGYSDYTKFSRAFSRWAGTTPRRYRDLLGTQTQAARAGCDYPDARANG